MNMIEPIKKKLDNKLNIEEYKKLIKVINEERNKENNVQNNKLFYSNSFKP